MSYNVIVNPATYSPVSSEIWIELDATGSTQSDFKYLVEVDKINLTTTASTYLGTFKFPPRPTTGYGLFTPHKCLRSSMSYDIHPFIQTVTTAPNSLSKFRYKYGFQYDPQIRFLDFLYYYANPDKTFVQIPSQTPLTQISVGDMLYLTLDNQSVNPQYNGTCSVLQSTYTYPNQYYTIDKTYYSATGTQSGVISQIRRNVYGTSSYYYAYNGTRQYDEIGTNFSDTRVFYPNSNYVNALTSYRNNVLSDSSEYFEVLNNSKSVFIDNYETLSVMVEPDGFTGATTSHPFYYIAIQVFDSTWTPIQTYSDSIYHIFPSLVNRRFDIPIGPQNLINNGWVPTGGVTGSFTQSKYGDGAKYYGIKIYYIDTQQYLQDLKLVKYYKIVCNPSPYSNFRIAFLNAHGGFDYWNFNWKSTNVINVNKTEFRKILDYNYTIGQRQDTILAQKVTETYTISSDWITEYDSNFLKELISSPEVYYVDEATQKYYPIIITDQSYTVKTAITDRMFCLSLNFKFAFDRNTYTH